MSASAQGADRAPGARGWRRVRPFATAVLLVGASMLPAPTADGACGTPRISTPRGYGGEFWRYCCFGG